MPAASSGASSPLSAASIASFRTAVIRTLIETDPRPRDALDREIIGADQHHSGLPAVVGWITDDADLLPPFVHWGKTAVEGRGIEDAGRGFDFLGHGVQILRTGRSEERRVGKEW